MELILKVPFSSWDTVWNGSKVTIEQDGKDCGSIYYDKQENTFKIEFNSAEFKLIPAPLKTTSKSVGNAVEWKNYDISNVKGEMLWKKRQDVMNLDPNSTISNKNDEIIYTSHFENLTKLQITVFKHSSKQVAATIGLWSEHKVFDSVFTRLSSKNIKIDIQSDIDPIIPISLSKEIFR